MAVHVDEYPTLHDGAVSSSDTAEAWSAMTDAEREACARELRGEGVGS